MTTTRRMIASDIFEDDFIGSLNYFERQLWIGSIVSMADDQGRMMDNPALFRSRVFLYDAVRDDQVEPVLVKLAAAKKITRYEAGNKRLIQLVKWWDYQTPAWASPSKYPAPEGWQDRSKYHAAGNTVIVTDWDKKGGYIAGYVQAVHSGLEDGDGDGDGKYEGEGKGKGDDESNAVPALAPESFAVSIYNGVVGGFGLPASDANDITSTCLTLMGRLKTVEAVKEYLQPFYKAFLDSKPRNKSRSYWLTDWAMTGQIPELTPKTSGTGHAEAENQPLTGRALLRKMITDADREASFARINAEREAAGLGE
jgi:hypothetical protein